MTFSMIIRVIYKEYLLMRPNLRQYGLLLLFYWIGCIFGLYPADFTVAMGQILFIMSTFVLFRREEQGNFRKYSLFLGRKESVTARYAFGVSMALFITMVNLIILVFLQIFTKKSTSEPLLALFFSTIGGLFAEFLALPLFYALDSPKAKPWFYLLILTPMTLLVIFYENITEWIDKIWIFGGFLALFFSLSLVLGGVLVLGLFSYQKSVEILVKKDFS